MYGTRLLASSYLRYCAPDLEHNPSCISYYRRYYNIFKHMHSERAQTSGKDKIRLLYDNQPRSVRHNTCARNLLALNTQPLNLQTEPDYAEYTVCCTLTQSHVIHVSIPYVYSSILLLCTLYNAHMYAYVCIYLYIRYAHVFLVYAYSIKYAADNTCESDSFYVYAAHLANKAGSDFESRVCNYNHFICLDTGSPRVMLV